MKACSKKHCHGLRSLFRTRIEILDKVKITSSPPRSPAFDAAITALRVDERGDGPPILLLHGGGGPRTVAGLSQALYSGARVLAPTHPGFDGAPRPGELGSIADLAAF